MWANVRAGEHYIEIRPCTWAGSGPPCVLWGPFSCPHAPGHSTILNKCHSGIFCPVSIYLKTWKKGSAIVFSHPPSDISMFGCKVSWGGGLVSSVILSPWGMCVFAVCIFFFSDKCFVCLLGQSVPLTLCSSMDCSPRGSSVHGISQARILEQVAISSSRGSSYPEIEPVNLTPVTKN